MAFCFARKLDDSRQRGANERYQMPPKNVISHRSKLRDKVNKGEPNICSQEQLAG